MYIRTDCTTEKVYVRKLNSELFASRSGCIAGGYDSESSDGSNHGSTRVVTGMIPTLPFPEAYPTGIAQRYKRH